ncbi:MAG TPA: hypothetical protein VK743_19425 [Steroidobacteraceae bacterium]|nr:hypothetical protein [Steroidobacteraceae bacterium]
MAETIIAETAVAMDAGSLSGRSAASWPSIIAGAFVAAAATVILVALGSGIGFASISPWPDRGASITSFAITTAIWLIVTQWVSAALGGYIAGRLRTRWMGTHPHEVFFRDTAHGLITWAVATILVVAVGASSFKSAAGTAGLAGAASANTAALVSANSPVSAYEIDRLFRTSNFGGAALLADARTETAHIAANAFANGSISGADRTYLVDQVSARTGAPQADAQARVDNFVAAVTEAQAKLKTEADSARKAAAEASIYLALSMLIGAFIASVSAALGGRIRDEHL